MDTRRRSPKWVRELDTRQLHGIATRLHYDRVGMDLSERQEWLWDSLISELEYRHRSSRPRGTACSCWLCVPPFED